MGTLFEKFLFVGSAVIVLNWLLTIGIVAESAITKRYSSHIWIPFVGPLCLTTLLITKGASFWTWPIPWVADIGTVMVLAATPRLFREYWRTSKYTRLLALTGSYANQQAHLSLHRHGHYLLTKKWHLKPTETGIAGLGELGIYETDGHDFILRSDSGNTRRLSSERNGSYAVRESGDFLEEYSLQGWALRIVDGDISQCS